MNGAAALAEALDRGGRVVWDRQPPRLLVPPDLRPRVEADRATVREVLRRAGVFRAILERFIREGREFSFLALPEARGRPDGCLSCAGRLEAGRHYRCRLCELAARIALDIEAAPEIPA